MSDIRFRYERMTKDQLIEHAIATHRQQETDRQHRQALKQDVARAEQLRARSILAMDRELGGPYITNLLLAVADTIEASHPLTSPPSEQTMRVNRPDSSRDEGAPTRRYRQLMRSIEWHLKRTTDTIRNNLEADPQLSEKRRIAACASHRARGSDHQCQYCPTEVAS